MPIYEYTCNDCQETFEVLTISSKTKEKIQCTKCKSENVRKVMSAGTIRSGSGPLFPQSTPPGGGCGGNSRFS